MLNIDNSQDTPDRQTSEGAVVSARKKRSRLPLVLLVVFVGFVILVFLTQKSEYINWIEDYQAGLAKAREQKKPVLLAFYKLHTRFCSLMSQNTYNNPDVIEYVEANFIPILIDVDKQPEIAKRYNINYYPTHYIKLPDSDELIGPHVGYDVPSVFIHKLKELLKKTNPPA